MNEEARDLWERGTGLLDQGDLDGAEGPLRRAVELFEQEQRYDAARSALAVLRVISSAKGDFLEEERICRRRIELAELLGDLDDQAHAHDDLGMALLEQDRLEEAIGESEQAIALAEQVGQPASLALFCSNLGDVYRRQKRYAPAKDAYERSLEAFQAAELHREVGIVYLDLGLLHRDEGQVDRARLALEAAAVVLDDIEDPRAEIAQSELAKLSGCCQSEGCPKGR